MGDKIFEACRMSAGTAITIVSFIAMCVTGFNHLKFRLEAETAKNKKQDEQIESMIQSDHARDLLIQAGNQNYAAILEKQRDQDGKLDRVLEFMMNIERVDNG
jgi:ABC-type nickel/cobalt efflux system permease component RcnA